ncbi:hypothetical protein [Metabacillus fastidiosus]|uniref:hypothetical protein n=1 Tax=Metabacillus fastidiosus TaxID=1458 RepID=UPI003D2C1185
MINKKKLWSEFKESSQMEKFNFIASIVTVSGVSIFTVLSGINKIDTVKIGVYLILFAIVLSIVSLIIGVYYWAITTVKTDLPPIVFGILSFLFTLFAAGSILIFVTSAWRFILTLDFVS